MRSGARFTRVFKQLHETVIHMQLHMAVEQSQAGIVGDEGCSAGASELAPIQKRQARNEE